MTVTSYVRFLLALMVVMAPPAMAAMPSPGCGRAAPAQTMVSFTVHGVERQAIVVVPSGYRSDRPMPLVLAFHGRTNDNAQLRGYLGLEQAATTSAIFVYPAALRDRSGNFTWVAPDERAPDVTLFDTILGDLERAYCIDRAAIFLVGHSLGASFANSLACARADEIRGVATVAGGIDLSRCTARVAAILLHNPSDELVPLSQGEHARDVLLGASLPASWPVSEIQQTFACQRAGGATTPLLWCLYHEDFTRNGRYYPHQWPKGASQLIMSYFADLIR